MPKPSDLRQSSHLKLLLCALLLTALLVVFIWRLRDSRSLIHLLGAGFLRRLAIPAFTIGTLAVSPLSLIKTLLFLGLLVVMSNRVRKLLYLRVSTTTAFDPQHSYVLARFVSIMIYVLGLMIGLQTAGVNLNSLAILGGTLGIGVGFGLQSIVANWVAGLVLLIEQPFRIGDRIDVGDTGGVVGRVGVRSTWVRTYDNEVIIVPNSDFTTHRVINWTVNDDKVRLSIGVVVAHDSDPQKVADLLLEVARKHPSVLPDPPPEALLAELMPTTLNFSLRVWTVVGTDDNYRLKSDLRFSVLRSFQEHGIVTSANSGSVGRASGA